MAFMQEGSFDYLGIRQTGFRASDVRLRGAHFGFSEEIAVLL